MEKEKVEKLILFVDSKKHFEEFKKLISNKYVKVGLIYSDDGIEKAVNHCEYEGFDSLLMEMQENLKKRVDFEIDKIDKAIDEL